MSQIPPAASIDLSSSSASPSTVMQGVADCAATVTSTQSALHAAIDLYITDCVRVAGHCVQTISDYIHDQLQMIRDAAVACQSAIDDQFVYLISEAYQYASLLGLTPGTPAPAVAATVSAASGVAAATAHAESITVYCDANGVGYTDTVQVPDGYSLIGRDSVAHYQVTDQVVQLRATATDGSGSAVTIQYKATVGCAGVVLPTPAQQNPVQAQGQPTGPVVGSVGSPVPVVAQSGESEPSCPAPVIQCPAPIVNVQVPSTCQGEVQGTPSWGGYWPDDWALALAVGALPQQQIDRLKIIYGPIVDALTGSSPVSGSMIPQLPSLK